MTEFHEKKINKKKTQHIDREKRKQHEQRFEKKNGNELFGYMIYGRKVNNGRRIFEFINLFFKGSLE